MVIQLDGVSYFYGEGTAQPTCALRDVTLTFGENEFTALIGHTGSGKSTLMQLLNGIEKASSGSVCIDGKNIYEKDFPMRELRRRVGLVFQYPEQQLFESSVIRDVAFGPKNMGWTDLQVEMSAFQALREVGISDELLDVSPLALSGGQKRRVAIAGVLAMQPELLVLDEPMAGLDPAGRTEIFELLCKLHKERGISILFASHSMDDVAEYAKRVIVMNEGKVVLDGTPAQVFRYEKELKQIGLGVPETVRLLHAMREAGCEVDDTGITSEDCVRAIVDWYRKRGVKC